MSLTTTRNAPVRRRANVALSLVAALLLAWAGVAQAQTVPRPRPRPPEPAPVAPSNPSQPSVPVVVVTPEPSAGQPAPTQPAPPTPAPGSPPQPAPTQPAASQPGGSTGITPATPAPAPATGGPSSPSAATPLAPAPAPAGGQSTAPAPAAPPVLTPGTSAPAAPAGASSGAAAATPAATAAAAPASSNPASPPPVATPGAAPAPAGGAAVATPGATPAPGATGVDPRATPSAGELAAAAGAPPTLSAAEQAFVRTLPPPQTGLGGIMAVIPARATGLAQVSTPAGAPVRMTLTIPTRSDTSIVARLQPVEIAQLPALSLPGVLAARGFTIDLYRTDSGQKISQHATPLELVIAYDDQDLGLTGGSPDRLSVMRWDEAARRPVPLRTEADPVARVLRVALDHISLFIITAHRPELPPVGAATPAAERGATDAGLGAAQPVGASAPALPLPLYLATSLLLAAGAIWLLRSAR